MSAIEVTKEVSVNDSSIPLPKRSWKGVRKTKGCNQLPELQRYIETIIKASSECESEDASLSDKDKFPKDRNFGRQTKGFDNKIKHEKVKFDLNMSKRKYKNKPSEAVSTDVEICSKSYTKFEDPRNWIFDKAQSLCPNLEIVHFLKKIYPNPYRTENLYELRTGLIFEHVKTDCLADDISRVDTEKRNSSLVIPGSESKPNVREKTPPSLKQNPSSESNDNNDKTPSKTSPNPQKTNENSNPPSNVSSRNSSRESTTESFYKRSLSDLKKRKNLKTKRKPATKDTLSKSESKIYADSGDYDIGKLNLLNTSDSNDSILHNTENKTTTPEDNDKSEELRKRNDLSDLLQIYSVMNKATESYLMLSSRTESNYSMVDPENGKKQINIQPTLIEAQTSEEKLTEEGEVTKNEKTTTEEPNTQQQTTTEDDNFDADKKLDEVLEFMYECLKNFKSQEKLLEETPKTDERDDDVTNEDVQNNLDKLMEVKKQPSARINRKSEIFTPGTQLLESKIERISHSTHQIITYPSVDNNVPDSTSISHESLPQTVESQNELGGYTEQSNTTTPVKTTKSVLPMSLKVKKTKTEALTTLKDVLETEEKLLGGEKKVSKNLMTFKPDIMIKNESKSSYSLTSGFKHPNSKFVICVNSYPRALRSIKPNITIPASLTFSTTDIRPWDLKPLTYYPKSKSKKLPIPPETEHNVVELGYNVRAEIKTTIHKTVLKCTAIIMGVKSVQNFPKTQNCSITTSELTVRVKPLKKSILVETNTMNTSVYKSTLTIQSSNTNFLSSSESVSIKADEKPVETLIEAINETEEQILLLQQKESDKYVMNDPCNDNCSDKKKIHDLLLRTYNLQQKLHNYLHQITYIQSSSCPFIQHELDLGLFLKDRTDLSWTEFNVQSNNPLVHWYYQEKRSKMDEAVAVNVQMVDDSTSYNPPEENDDDDDNSSTYSFKSSNDFSEDPPKDPSCERDDFVKQLLDKIDLYQKTFEKPPKEDNLEMMERIENKLIEYDPKTPAKVLKTVFRGKDSSTELTIGLKDVPMTKVNNISVEKTKYSPNHTKISICISKERPEELLQGDFPPYYLKNAKSLSTSESSRLEVDGNSNEDTDDDDFQSVASTLDHIDSDKDDKVIKNTKVTSQKNYTKHRFNFYKKMELDVDDSKTRNFINPVYRYKELEPLKEALTDMQMRVRNIKRDVVLTSNDYYERALKLAKMSAGFCQNCGNRAVIPKDTLGYYKTLIPRKYVCQKRSRHFRPFVASKSNFYSDLGGHVCDLDVKHSSSCLFNRTSQTNRTVFRTSFHDMPILFERT